MMRSTRRCNRGAAVCGCDFCGCPTRTPTLYTARETRITVCFGPDGSRVVLAAGVDAPLQSLQAGWTGTTYVFSPDWLACSVCRHLLDADDRVGLLRRAQAQAGSTDVTLAMAHEAFFYGREAVTP